MNPRKRLENPAQDVDAISFSMEMALIASLMVLTIFCFNLEHILADVLWHDDGLYFYRASEGIAFQTWRGKIALLVPYRDFFYANGMLIWGLPVTRTVFVLVMSLSSISLYYIYKKIFGFATEIAAPTALIPNILPSLIGIPLSLNASYAMWGLLGMLISMQLMYRAFTASDKLTYFYWICSFLIYAIGLNLTVSSTFMIPSFFLFFGIFVLSFQRKLRSIVLILPFFVLGIWQLYKHISFSPIKPAQIPFDEMIDRSIQFLEVALPFQINNSSVIYVALFVISLGIIGIVTTKSRLITKPPHFCFSERVYRLLMVLWPLAWIVCNGIAYVAVAPTFRVEDYAYVSNFGTVFLLGCGGVFSWNWISGQIGWQKRYRDRGLVLILVGFTIFTGIQKLEDIRSFLDRNGFTRISSSLRSQLRLFEIPTDSQILILDVPTFHPGHYETNTGYARYLLGRRDVGALFGPNKFPNDVFSKSKGFWDRMNNFDPERPVLMFEKNGAELASKKLLLQVKPTARDTPPRLQWSLFDVSQQGSIPVKIAGDLGMSSYYEYIENQLPSPFTSSDIVFGPGSNPGMFLSRHQAEKIAQSSGLIDSELNFGDIVALRAVHEVHAHSRSELELLIQAKNTPGNIKLGYRINDGEPTRLDIWEMAMSGDNILVKIEITASQRAESNVAFQFMNMGTWPFTVLESSSGKSDDQDISGPVMIRLNFK